MRRAVLAALILLAAAPVRAAAPSALGRKVAAFRRELRRQAAAGTAAVPQLRARLDTLAAEQRAAPEPAGERALESARLDLDLLASGRPLPPAPELDEEEPPSEPPEPPAPPVSLRQARSASEAPSPAALFDGSRGAPGAAAVAPPSGEGRLDGFLAAGDDAARESALRAASEPLLVRLGENDVGVKAARLASRLSRRLAAHPLRRRFASLRLRAAMGRLRLAYTLKDGPAGEEDLGPLSEWLAEDAPAKDGKGGPVRTHLHSLKMKTAVQRWKPAPGGRGGGRRSGRSGARGGGGRGGGGGAGAARGRSGAVGGARRRAEGGSRGPRAASGHGAPSRAGGARGAAGRRLLAPAARTKAAGRAFDGTPKPEHGRVRPSAAVRTAPHRGAASGATAASAGKKGAGAGSTRGAPSGSGLLTPHAVRSGPAGSAPTVAAAVPSPASETASGVRSPALADAPSPALPAMAADEELRDAFAASASVPFPRVSRGEARGAPEPDPVRAPSWAHLLAVMGLLAAGTALFQAAKLDRLASSTKLKA